MKLLTGLALVGPYVFPCAVVALSVGASCVYLAVSDWRRAVYWAAAAVITASVTF